MFDLFLSYHWRDHEPVEALARALRARELTVFLDRWYLAPGQPWPQALERTLSECRAVAVCLGRGAMGPWQQREMNFALERQAKEAGFPVIPVLLPGAEPALGFLGQNTWLDLRQRPDDPALLQILVLAARGEPPGAELQDQVRATLAAICPYRGLQYFREEDAPFFFGRDAAIGQILTSLERHSLLAIIGASGSGKSSVVRAGLVPALRKGALGKVWEIATLVPTDRPLHALAAALMPLLEPEMTETDRLVEVGKQARHLAAGELRLRDVTQRVLEKQPGTDRLLLMIDQWEELYTLADAAACARFIAEILDTAADGRVSVVLTLRGDFFGHVLAQRPLADRLQDSLVHLGPMTRQELEQAIRMPADKLGLEFAPGLADRILDDVGDEPGNLPLLEFVLRALWERRHGANLLHDAYGSMGQLRGAVASKAEALFKSLGALEQNAVKRIFTQLVRLGEGSEADTRRRATLEEIGATSVDLVKRLADERLLVTTHGTSAGQEIVELSHEALILHWGRLANWLNADREFLLWRQRLRQSCEEWTDKQLDAGALLRGARLTDAEERLASHRDGLSAAETAYIEASLAQREREIQSARRRRRLAVAGLVTGLVLAVALSLWANIERQRATRERDTARAAQIEADDQRNVAFARQLAAQATLALNSPPIDVVKGALLSAESLRRAHTLEGYTAWQTAMGLLPPRIIRLAHRDPVRKLDFSPDGTRLAVAVSVPGTSAGQAQLWNVANPQPLATFKHAGWIVEAAFSPDGKLLATGSWDHSVTIADAETGRELRRLERDDAVSALAFSPDGARLAVGEKDGTLSLLESRSGSELARMKHTDRIVALAFSADGSRLAAASEDKAVVLWNSASGVELNRLAYKGWLMALAFSAAGPRLIVRNSDDDGVALFDLETGKTLAILNKDINTAAFAADGSHFVAGGQKIFGLWLAASGRMLASQTHDGFVRNVAVSASGAQIAIADSNDRVIVWDTSENRERFRFAHDAYVTSIVLSPDGKRIATGCKDKLVRLWDIATGQELARFPQAANPGRVAFSPKGDRLLTTVGLSDYSDSYAWGEIALWNARDWRRPARLAAMPVGLDDLSFGRQGDVLVTLRSDKTARLVDAKTDAERARLTLDKMPRSVRLTSDGTRLVAAGPYLVLTAGVWNVASRRRLFSLSDPGGVDGIAFDRTHRLIATSGQDGSFRVWNAATGAQLHGFRSGYCLSGDGKLYARWKDRVVEIRQVATDQIASRLTLPEVPITYKLGLDGSRVAVLTKSMNVELWDTAKQALVARLAHPYPRAAGELSHPNQPEYVPIFQFEFGADGALLATAGNAGRVYLWNVATGQLIRQLAPRSPSGPSLVRFSPDGRRLATVNSGIVSVWDTRTGQQLREIKCDQEKQCGSQTFNSDGSRIAFGVGGSAEVWDIGTGKRLFGFPISENWIVRVLAFSPDGARLAVGSYDVGAGARVFDLNTGEEQLRLRLDADVKELDFTADGKRLITADGGGVARAWDMATGREAFRFAHGPSYIDGISYDANADRVATTRRALVQVWETASGRRLAQFSQDADIGQVALSPDGSLLANLKKGASQVDVVKLESGRTTGNAVPGTIFTLRHEGEIGALAFSSDGAMIVTGGQDDIRLWDANSGKRLVQLGPQEGKVTRVLLSDDKTVLAAAIDKPSKDEVQLWQVKKREKLAVVPHDSGLDMAFRPDTTTLAIADVGTTVRIVDPDSAMPERARHALGGKKFETLVSPDAQLIATRRREAVDAEIRDLGTGKRLMRVAHDGPIWGMAFSPDARRIATRGEDKTTRLWDVTTGRELLRLASPDGSASLRFSPDGKRIVTSRPRWSQHEEAHFEVHDTVSGALIGKPIEGFINALAFSPDSRYLATGEGWIFDSKPEPHIYVENRLGFFGARLWEAESGREVMRLPHDSIVGGVTFNPDGRLIATWTNTLGDPVRLWNSGTDSLLAELAAPPKRQGVEDLQFSPDGHLLAVQAGSEISIWRVSDRRRVGLVVLAGSLGKFSFSPDGALLATTVDRKGLIWDWRQSRPLVRLRDVDSIRFTPDGKRVIAVHSDDTVRIWDLRAEDMITDTCSRLERNLTREEWSSYIGGETYRPTCPDLPVADR